MKIIFSCLLILITFVSYGQKNQLVDLRWKIDKDDPLNYITVMSNVEVESDEHEKISENPDNDVEEEVQGLFNLLSQLSNNMNNQKYLTTLLSKDNGVIDIIMNTPPQEEIDDSAYRNWFEALNEISNEEDMEEEFDEEEFINSMKISRAMQSMYQGVTLRGSVYESGAIHSFWVKNSQKNLIALLFQLPENLVKIGDKWSIDVNFIENDQTFVCDNGYKTNEVTLTDIKEVNGEKIAVLNYNIVEYVEGNVDMSSLGDLSSLFGNEELFTFFNQEGKTIMKYSYQGTAEFSIDRGQWLSYKGITDIERSGSFDTKQRIKYALINQ